MDIKVLWIEDDSRSSLSQLAGPVYVQGKCDLDIANDVATAISLITEKKYDVLIIDIRLPAGDDQDWQKCYLNGGGDKIRARLGLQLINSLLGRPDADVKIDDRPKWITSNLIGVFTVEGKNEIERALTECGINVYHQKRADLPDTILINIIEEILSQQ